MTAKSPAPMSKHPNRPARSTLPGGAGFTPASRTLAQMAGIKPAPPYGLRTIVTGMAAFVATLTPLSLGAATLTPPPPSSAPQIQLPPGADQPPPSELPKIVASLAAQPSLSAADCAKLAQETITHGQAAQQSGQPAKPGILNDGLAAVNQGESLDTKAADWPALRSQLQELLQPPPPQDKQEDKKDDEKKQDEKKEEQQKEEQKQQDEQQKQDQKSQDKDQEQKKDEQQSEQQKQEQEKQQQAQQSDKPEPPKDTQSVGGEKPKDDERKEHPELAVPLKKLDQVRDKDSPAELFQMLHNDEPAPAGQPKKDW